MQMPPYRTQILTECFDEFKNDGNNTHSHLISTLLIYGNFLNIIWKIPPGELHTLGKSLSVGFSLIV